MSDKRVEAAVDAFRAAGMFLVATTLDGGRPAISFDVETARDIARVALQAADAADTEHVRVPRANLEAMLQYVDAYLKKAGNGDVPVGALCTVGDDLQLWLEGYFGPIPGGDSGTTQA